MPKRILCIRSALRASQINVPGNQHKKGLLQQQQQQEQCPGQELNDCAGNRNVINEEKKSCAARTTIRKPGTTTVRCFMVVLMICSKSVNSHGAHHRTDMMVVQSIMSIIASKILAAAVAVAIAGCSVVQLTPTCLLSSFGPRQEE